VFSKYKTPTPSISGDNIANFINAFQKEDLGVENLAFKKKDENNKIKNENKAIKNEEQIELRVIIFNNLLVTIVISRRQGSKKINNNTKKYNLKKSIKEIR